MADDGVDAEVLYETVKRATRDAVYELFWDVVTVVIAVLLVALGIPVAIAGVGGDGHGAWFAVLVGLVIVTMGLHQLYTHFAPRLKD